MCEKPHINVTQKIKKRKSFKRIHTIHTNMKILLRKKGDIRDGFAFILDNT